MPSQKVLQEKQEIVKHLAEEFKSAQTLVLAEYRGLSVEQDTELRAEMRKGHVDYKVIKNTLGRLAAKEAGLADLEELFVGPTAVALSHEDPISPAKILKKYQEKFEPLKVKGGASEGRVLELKELDKLASVPDIEVLYAQLVGGLSSPIRALACYLKAIAEKCEEAGAETAEAVYQGKAGAVEEEKAESETSENSSEAAENQEA